MLGESFDHGLFNGLTRIFLKMDSFFSVSDNMLIKTPYGIKRQEHDLVSGQYVIILSNTV